MTDRRHDWGWAMARAFMKYGREAAKQQQVATARNFVRQELQRQEHLISKEGNRRAFREQLSAEKTEVVLSAARKGDADAIDVLRDRARTGNGLSDEFHAFIRDYFINGQPKAPPGGHVKNVYIRNQVIAWMVRFVSATYGLPEYRNAEHRGEKSGPISACQLVGEEIGLSEDRIEKIFAAEQRVQGESAFRATVLGDR